MMNWEVQKESLFDGNGNVIDNHHLLRRDDNQHILAVHKDSYNVLSNERFIQICDRLVEATDGKIEKFKEFNGGSKMIAKITPSDSIKKICGYDMNQMIAIVNSHDGSHGLTFGTSSHYYVCSNEFNRIRKGGSTIRHTKSMDFNIDQALLVWQSYQKQLSLMNNNFTRFSNAVVSKDLIESLTNRLFDVENVEEMSTRKSNIITKFNNSLEEELTRHGKNAWGFFNGVTNYATHQMKENINHNISNKCYDMLVSEIV